MMKEQNNIRKITVLNVVPDERFGGPQQRVLQVAKKLKEKDIDTIVVMPAGDNTFAKMLYDAGILSFQLRSFRRLPHPSNLAGVILWFLFLIACMYRIFRLIREHHVDVVHVNGGLNVQVSLAARLSGVKVLWHLNDVRHSALIGPVGLLLRVLPHKLAASSRAVERCYFGQRGNENMSILYPPVDTEVFDIDGTRLEEYRREFGITPDEKVVGIVGNLNPFKGYEYFLQAANLVKQEFPAVKFLVVGKRLDTHEKYWQKVQLLCEKINLQRYVIFTGARSDVPQLMNLMDVFVMASLFESFSMVTAEAMACGRPIVATEVGGVPELVSEDETCLLVPARNPEAIAEAVLTLLRSSEKAKAMGRKGRERAVEFFDIEICARNHNDIYTSMLL